MLVSSRAVTLFLGEPEQTNRAAPLFTASLLHPAVRTRNPQPTTTGPSGLCSRTSARHPRLWSPRPGAEHSTALLVYAAGPQALRLQVTSVPTETWEVSSPGEARLAQFRPPQRQNTAPLLPGQKAMEERPLKLPLLPPSAGRDLSPGAL